MVATLAIAAFSTIVLEAKDGHKNCLDPLVGTWNLEIEARRQTNGADKASEEVQQNNEQERFLVGVATFHKDCTVVFAVRDNGPTEEESFNDHTSHLLGIWQRNKNGEYEILLSSVGNRRFETRITLILVDDCEKARFTGTFSRRFIEDLCFDGPSQQRFILRGRACKLSLCPPGRVAF